jgi:hypothetical protein
LNRSCYISLKLKESYALLIWKFMIIICWIKFMYSLRITMLLTLHFCPFFFCMFDTISWWWLDMFAIGKRMFLWGNCVLSLTSFTDFHSGVTMDSYFAMVMSNFCHFIFFMGLTIAKFNGYTWKSNFNNTICEGWCAANWFLIHTGMICSSRVILLSHWSNSSTCFSLYLDWH